jgi:hypothetical protein
MLTAYEVRLSVPHDCLPWNMDREAEIQCLTQAEQHIAKIDEHIRWQREVVDIVERITTSAEAAEGARALLTTFLEAQAQHQKTRDRIRACLYGNTVPTSTTPLLFPEAQAQHDEDHGCGQISATLDAKSDPFSAAPLMLSEAQTEREPDNAIQLPPDFDLGSPARVPFQQSIDDRNEIVIHARREQADDQIHLSPDCHHDSPAAEPLEQSFDGRSGIPDPEHREQDANDIGLGLDCADDLPSTPMPEPPNDHQSKLIAPADIAGTCANPTSVHLEAKPGNVWRIVRACAAWICRHICRARS